MNTPSKRLVSFSPENLPSPKRKKLSYLSAHLGVRVSVDKR